jgi:DNA-binding transcriptional LysR family regulator
LILLHLRRNSVDDFAEFRHFRYLLAVAQHKGFRAAAEALNTAQPSLSRQIKEFQEYYNLRLFIPGKGKRVELTAAGEALEVIAREVLEVKDDALAALEAIQRGEAQVLRIGCTPFVDKGICKRATDLQKVLIPSASVRMSTGDTSALISELKNDQLDAIIVTLPVKDEDLKVHILKRERLVVCLPTEHPLSKKAALSANDLTSNLTVFRHPHQHPEAHERLVELLAELGVQFDEQSHTSHPHEMQEMVKSGYGFSLIREGTTLLDGLTTRPIIGVEWTVDTAFVHRVNPRVKILPMIAKILKRQFSKMASMQGRKKSPQSAKPEDNNRQMKLLG